MVSGHDGAYYVNEWADEIAEQVFARFEQQGVFDPQTGMAYREVFHAPGIERPLRESFEVFMGQPPAGL